VNQTTTDIFRLDGPSFDELLNTATLTMAKVNNNMRETVTLSQHFFYATQFGQWKYF
jgi:hypothetical protein